MYKFALLLTLSTLLAACNTQAPVSSQTPSALGSVNNTSSVVFKDNVAQFEAKVDADLAQLEKRGLSGQAVAPYVYLNVLKLPSSVDTVRAYFKTTAPSGTACSIAWGDGSSDVVPGLKVPTTTRVDTFDHTYTSSGTRTVTATCTGVGSQSVGVNVTVASTGVTLDFETPVIDAFTNYASFMEKGYTFTSVGSSRSPAVMQVPAWRVAPSQTVGSNSVNNKLVMRRTDNTLFSLSQLDYASASNSVGLSTMVGYKPGGGTVSFAVKTLSGNVRQTATLPSSFQGLERVEFDDASVFFVVDNLKVAP